MKLPHSGSLDSHFMAFSGPGDGVELVGTLDDVLLDEVVADG